tara:strand:+ start:1043 stop:1153 length:111 start_codon:yes stop_codon:yes gene_type:complete
LIIKFINKRCPIPLSLEEGGFYIMSQSQKGFIKNKN